jgi:hypothetical protein
LLLESLDRLSREEVPSARALRSIGAVPARLQPMKWQVLVQFPINGCSFWQNDFSGFYAAKISGQSAGTVTSFFCQWF